MMTTSAFSSDKPIARQQFDLIVFDWDGTLFDSTAQIVYSLQAASRDLGVPVPAQEAARYVIGLGWQEALKIAVPKLDPKDYQTFSASYRRHYLTGESRLQLFEGVPDMLRELRETGYLLAVATGASRAGLNRALTSLGLTSHFDATRCADETFAKPHPAMLQELSEELDQNMNRILMVGDTIHDLQMAANAGAQSIAVAHAGRATTSFGALTPQFCACSIAELTDWLRKNG